MNIIPKGIIIHSMAEYLDLDGGPKYAKDFLKSLNLSVHGFIKPDGIYDSMVSSPNKASHAGKSEWGEWRYLNGHFLGVELLVEGIHTYSSFKKVINKGGTYSQEQFDSLIRVCKWWKVKYNIKSKNIVRHSDVSGDDIRGKGRGKIDPGSAFDWVKFKREIQE